MASRFPMPGSWAWRLLVHVVSEPSYWTVRSFAEDMGCHPAVVANRASELRANNLLARPARPGEPFRATIYGRRRVFHHLTHSHRRNHAR